MVSGLLIEIREEQSGKSTYTLGLMHQYRPLMRRLFQRVSFVREICSYSLFSAMLTYFSNGLLQGSSRNQVSCSLNDVAMEAPASSYDLSRRCLSCAKFVNVAPESDNEFDEY